LEGHPVQVEVKIRALQPGEEQSGNHCPAALGRQSVSRTMNSSLFNVSSV